MDTFETFRKFPTLALAKEKALLLNNKGIETKLTDNLPPVDITFSGNTLQNEYEIKIQQSKFEQAEKILEQEAEKEIQEIDKDYYLFQFSDDELYEILLKSDEWNAFDCALANKILIDRGKPVDAALIKSLKNERIKQLEKPEENQKPWIIAGYIFAIFGGLISILIGYSLMTSQKTTLPNGKKMYSYSEKDRAHGKIIFYAGIVSAIFWLLIKILNSNN